MDILVLGARGGLGRLVCAELAARGHRTRPATRAEARDPEALAALAARRTGARLVYVGVHHAPALARGAYIDAHERVAAAMRDLDGVVVRPTGFFSAYAALLPLARRGILVDIGDGRARTNPIDERELAAIVAESVAGPGPRELAVGGPEVLTRGRIMELVAERAGRRVRMMRIPAWLAGASGAVLRVLHPRMGQFARFAAGLAQHDVIAPALGASTLASYLDALAVASPSRDRRASSSSAR
jgi:uncharacterized protein YbjT (DUF2867 family)